MKEFTRLLRVAESELAAMDLQVKSLMLGSCNRQEVAPALAKVYHDFKVLTEALATSMSILRDNGFEFPNSFKLHLDTLAGWISDLLEDASPNRPFLILSVVLPLYLHMVRMALVGDPVADVWLN